ncbi:uncharacterized protein Aud_004547 [Aspergillus udagawae]|uniref:Uncharacterized protein n=1 Tax=Aspergillus udagawae TaxID=91492 RepID=A0A8E0QSM6_9EURO|nr:uncharacterized protein Aud_004547 [Aspergillus udagawae]GIC88156.1 hypothetical protein Aud_004547 [Aspergillus udagawae]
MDLRTPSALPDITDIGTFPSGGAYSSRTSSEPHALLAQLLKAHFLRLRKTLLLTIRLEFETAHLLDSSIGPLSIGPAQSELRFEHLPAHGEGEGAGGQETSAKDMDIEAGDYAHMESRRESALEQRVYVVTPVSGSTVDQRSLFRGASIANGLSPSCGRVGKPRDVDIAPATTSVGIVRLY